MLINICREMILVWKRLAYFLCFEDGPLESFLPLRSPGRDACFRCESLVCLASATLRGTRRLSGGEGQASRDYTCKIVESSCKILRAKRFLELRL